MKKLTILFAFSIGLIMASQAQVSVNVGVNIGGQPDWGPAGYDRADYYYFPDMDVYYDVPQRQYVYMNNGRWFFGASLPGRYRNYDVYNCYKVVINEPRPYLRADMYRSRYGSYSGRRGQVMIRDRYQQNNYYRRDNDNYRHDNGNHYGWRNGRGNGGGRGNGHGHH
jgi:hypothetical protein